VTDTILFTNNAYSTLAEPLLAADTTAFLAPGTGDLFPTVGVGTYFVMTFSDAATGLITEIVHVTARDVDEITIVRAQEGTTALDWVEGSRAENLWTAGQAAALGQGGGGGGTGTGAAQFLYNPADATALTSNPALVVGNSYDYIHADTTKVQGGGGTMDVLDATGNGPVDGTWLFDLTTQRSYMLGAGSPGSQFRLFKNLSRKEDLASWRLNTNSGSGQDAIINSAVQAVRNAYHADLFATSLGPPLTGVGVYFPTDTIDAANANWDAPQLTVMAPTTFTSIKPVLRFGRPTSNTINSRLDNPQVIRATVKGANSSTDLTLSNAIGVQLYDIASPVCEVDVNNSRLQSALDIATNTEKIVAKVGGAYNWILVRYTPVQVSAAYTGSGASVPCDQSLWPYLQNKGSWNPVTNTPTLLTGQAYLYKGWFWKASASATLSPALDGITSVVSGDVILSDGVFFQKRKSVNFSPDSNRIWANGESNAQYLYMPDAADCSFILSICAEGRVDPGPAYDIVNFQGATIPFPGIYDGNGKETVFQQDSWARAGDSRLFYYGNKDNGMDTTILGFDTDHLKGTIVRIDRALRVKFGGVYKDCLDGTYLGNTGAVIPCPVVQLGNIGIILGEIQIIQATNTVAGILNGDPSLGITLQNVRYRASVQMGTQTGPTDMTAGRSFVAQRGQSMINVIAELRETQGQILLPDLCFDGVTPTNLHNVTHIVDPVFCSAGGAYVQGATVDAQIIVRGAMTFAEARAAVSNWSGITNARFEDITDYQGGMTYNGQTWFLA